MGRPAHVLSSGVAAAMIAVALVGCTDRFDDAGDGGPDEGPSISSVSSAADPGRQPSPSTTPVPTTSQPPIPVSDEPVTSTTDEPATATTSQATRQPPADSTAERARQAQIPPAQLPGVDAQGAWETRAAGPGPGPDMPSVCLRSSLTAIGAVSEYRTDFAGPPSGTQTAVQMTAVFPDAQPAATAADVIESWRRTCSAHASADLGLGSARVTQVGAVSTPVGAGYRWLVTYRTGTADAEWSQAEGFVTDNDTMTYLVLRSAGRGGDGPGASPIDRALAVAGRFLEQSRSPVLR